ncbi:hypothetical protein DFQ27_000138, partial [Actinomortierella ambigua]
PPPPPPPLPPVPPVSLVQQPFESAVPEANKIIDDTNSSSSSSSSADPTTVYVKNGMMTSKLIKRLADIVESSQGAALKSKLTILQKKQNDKERSLFNQRNEVTRRHATELNSLQAKEIMGINVTMERNTTKRRHGKELRQFDKGVMAEMDDLMFEQQQMLREAGIPMMHPSRDPVEIGVQVKIVRLLEDMLNNET